MFNNMVALKINPQVITLMKTFSSSNHYKKSRKWSFEMLLIMVVYQDNKPHDKKKKDIKFIWNTLAFILEFS